MEKQTESTQQNGEQGSEGEGSMPVAVWVILGTVLAAIILAVAMN